jgi:hypothetical protein
MKRVLLACVAALALSGEARAITFLTTQFDTNAVATAEGAPPGIDSASGPPTPVSASADAVGAVNIAIAGAIGAPGLLNTSAEASGGGGIASAVGTSHFLGTFLMSGAEPLLVLDFDPTSFASGSGVASTFLFASLTAGATTLFDDLVTGLWTYNLAPGITYSLELTLSSEASAGLPATVGDASSSGQVAIMSAVPLPATWLLLLTGLGPIAVMRKRTAQVRRGVA